MFFLTPISKGVTLAAIKCLLDVNSGLVIPWKDFFIGYNVIGLISLITGIIFLVMFIPYIGLFVIAPYISLAWMFSVPISFLHPEIANFECLKTSTEVINNKICRWIFFGIVTLAMNIIGALPFGLGLFVTIPITLINVGVAYKLILIDDLAVNNGEVPAQNRI